MRCRIVAARQSALVVVALISLSACSRSGSNRPGLAADTYSGPLYVAHASGAHPSAGAAGQVVDCRTWGDGDAVTTTPYGDGATSKRPEQALDEQGIFDGPANGLEIAAETADRVLYVLDVRHAIKEAVIVHNGPATAGAGGPGWYVESWAACDLSEFPRTYTDALGIQVWTDSTGQPVPVTTIQSTQGPKHCDWQSMTLLSLEKATYVRDPLPDFADYFASPYQAHAQLPHDAVNTGYQHDNNKLWLSEDKQVAYIGTAEDVEAWPREARPLLCA